MSLLFKGVAYIGWLLVVAFVVLAIASLFGGFDHPWSDPPV